MAGKAPPWVNRTQQSGSRASAPEFGTSSSDAAPQQHDSTTRSIAWQKNRVCADHPRGSSTSKVARKATIRARNMGIESQRSVPHLPPAVQVRDKGAPLAQQPQRAFALPRNPGARGETSLLAWSTLYCPVAGEMMGTPRFASRLK